MAVKSMPNGCIKTDEISNGQSIGVGITYLELEHVGSPLPTAAHEWCSTSVELTAKLGAHIYLSSLGVNDGKDVVDHGRDAYLSAIGSVIGGDMCLPGGWPKPFNLRDLMWYSRETTFRTNCMYLEFLGAQYASHQPEINCRVKLRDSVLATEEPGYNIDTWTSNKISFPITLEHVYWRFFSRGS